MELFNINKTPKRFGIIGTEEPEVVDVKDDSDYEGAEYDLMYEYSRQSKKDDGEITRNRESELPEEVQSKEPTYTLDPRFHNVRSRKILPLYLQNLNDYPDDLARQLQIRRATVAYRHHLAKKELIHRLSEEKATLLLAVKLYQTRSNTIVDACKCSKAMDVILSSEPPENFLGEMADLNPLNPPRTLSQIVTKSYAFNRQTSQIELNLHQQSLFHSCGGANTQIIAPTVLLSNPGTPEQQQNKVKKPAISPMKIARGIEDISEPKVAPPAYSGMEKVKLIISGYRQQVKNVSQNSTKTGSSQQQNPEKVCSPEKIKKAAKGEEVPRKVGIGSVSPSATIINSEKRQLDSDRANGPNQIKRARKQRFPETTEPETQNITPMGNNNILESKLPKRKQYPPRKSHVFKLVKSSPMVVLQEPARTVQYSDDQQKVIESKQTTTASVIVKQKPVDHNEDTLSTNVQKSIEHEMESPSRSSTSIPNEMKTLKTERKPENVPVASASRRQRSQRTAAIFRTNAVDILKGNFRKGSISTRGSSVIDSDELTYTYARPGQ